MLLAPRWILVIFLGFCFFSSYGQTIYKSQLLGIADSMISHLKSCDTSFLIEALDRDKSGLTKPSVRRSIVQDLLNSCEWMNKILGKYNIPDKEKWVFKIDEETGIGIVEVPLVYEDSALNLKRALIQVAFPPEKYFTGKVFRFLLAKEFLKHEPEKIFLPKNYYPHSQQRLP